MILQEVIGSYKTHQRILDIVDPLAGGRAIGPRPGLPGPGASPKPAPG